MSSPLRRFAPFVLLLSACGGAEETPPIPVPASLPEAPAQVSEPELMAAPANGSQAQPTTSPPPAVEFRPEVVSEAWYDVLTNRSKSGWYHVVWTTTLFEGRPAIHDRTVNYSLSTRQMGRIQTSFEAKTVREIDRTPDGMLLSQTAVTTQADRDTVTWTKWTGASYTWVQSVAGMTERREIPCEKPVPVDTEAFLHEKIVKGEVAVGQEYRYQRLNMAGKRLDTVVVEVTKKALLSTPAGPKQCWRLREYVEKQPGTQYVWLDTDGIIRKRKSGGEEIVSSTPETARVMPALGHVYSITLPAEPRLPRCTSLDRCLVDVSLTKREGVEDPEFPETPFSRQVGKSDGRIQVELLAHDDPEATVALPVKEESVRDFLERTTLFCTDHPTVQQVVKNVVGKETDGRKVATKLLEYVFLSLSKSSPPIPQPTAAEIIEEGRGDCSEHCVLFVALARAAGLPARRLSGYAQVGNRWGAHSFAEVWLGKWVGADPTTNELGTKARYLCFGWADDPDSYPGLVSSRVTGRMSIKTREFSEGGKTWKVGALPKTITREDPMSGLALAEPPANWSATVLPGSGRGTIIGPGLRCRVSMEFGSGNLPVHVLKQWSMPRGTPGKFAGRDALHYQARRYYLIMVPFKRRAVALNLSIKDGADKAAALATIEKILAPTFE